MGILCKTQKELKAELKLHVENTIDENKIKIDETLSEADLIGETGLDYYRNLSTKEEQIENLKFICFTETYLRDR